VASSLVSLLLTTKLSLIRTQRERLLAAAVERAGGPIVVGGAAA